MKITMLTMRCWTQFQREARYLPAPGRPWLMVFPPLWGVTCFHYPTEVSRTSYASTVILFRLCIHSTTLPSPQSSSLTMLLLHTLNLKPYSSFLSLFLIVLNSCTHYDFFLLLFISIGNVSCIVHIDHFNLIVIFMCMITIHYYIFRCRMLKSARITQNSLDHGLNFTLYSHACSWPNA